MKTVKKITENDKNNFEDKNTLSSLFLGNIYGEQFHDGYAGAVFHTNGISPTVTTRSVLSGALLILEDSND